MGESTAISLHTSIGYLEEEWRRVSKWIQDRGVSDDVASAVLDKCADRIDRINDMHRLEMAYYKERVTAELNRANDLVGELSKEIADLKANPPTEDIASNLPGQIMRTAERELKACMSERNHLISQHEAEIAQLKLDHVQASMVLQSQLIDCLETKHTAGGNRFTYNSRRLDDLHAEYQEELRYLKEQHAKELSSSNESIANLENVVENMAIENANLLLEIDTFDQRSEDLRKSAKKYLDKRLEDANREHQVAMEVQRAEYINQLNAVETGHAECTEHLITLRQDIEILSKDNEVYRSTIQNLRAKIIEHQKTIGDQENTIEDLTVDRENFTQIIQTRDREANHCKDELQRVNADLNRAITGVIEPNLIRALKKIEALETKLATMLPEIQGLSAFIATMEKVVNAVDVDREQFQEAMFESMLNYIANHHGDDEAWNNVCKSLKIEASPSTGACDSFNSVKCLANCSKCRWNGTHCAPR